MNDSLYMIHELFFFFSFIFGTFCVCVCCGVVGLRYVTDHWSNGPHQLIYSDPKKNPTLETPNPVEARADMGGSGLGWSFSKSSQFDIGSSTQSEPSNWKSRQSTDRFKFYVPLCRVQTGLVWAFQVNQLFLGIIHCLFDASPGSSLLGLSRLLIWAGLSS